jgi:hypothetical protein
MWTYSGDPATSDKDEVRFLMGDTDDDFQLMSDEEIAYVIAKALPVYADNWMVASICCDIVANALAREISISADGVSAGADQLMSKFQATAKNLRVMYDRIRGVGGVPIVGGIDWFCPPDFSVKPLVFGMGFTDNMRAGQQNYGNEGEYPYAYEYPDNDGGYWSGP